MSARTFLEDKIFGGWSLYSGGTDSFERFTAEFQPQRQWCIKILLPWAQKSDTPLVLGRGSKCPWQNCPPTVVVRDRKNQWSMTARDVTGFYDFFSVWNRAIFSTFWGHFLTKLRSRPGEKGKNIHWRKNSKNPVATAPRNWRWMCSLSRPNVSWVVYQIPSLTNALNKRHQGPFVSILLSDKKHLVDPKALFTLRLKDLEAFNQQCAN